MVVGMIASWVRTVVVMGVCISWTATRVRAAEPAALERPDASVSVMRGVIARYSEDHAALLRCYSLGFSERRRERLGRFYTEQQRVLEGVDFLKLDRAGRVDYLLLKNAIEFETRQLEHGRKQFAEVAPLLPFAQGVAGLEEARARMEAMDAERSAKALAAIGAQVAGARKGLDAVLKGRSESSAGAAGPAAMEKVLVDRAARQVDSLDDEIGERTQVQRDEDRDEEEEDDVSDRPEQPHYQHDGHGRPQQGGEPEPRLSAVGQPGYFSSWASSMSA